MSDGRAFVATRSESDRAAYAARLMTTIVECIASDWTIVRATLRVKEGLACR